MQAVKVIIPGSFWDSQIYSSYLHLFLDDGSIAILDWKNAIDKLIQDNQKIAIALKVAFLDGNLLYEHGANYLLSNEEIKGVINRQFKELLSKTFEFENINDSRFNLRHQNNPFPFPHADSEIYHGQIYVGLKSGLFSSQKQDVKDKEIQKKSLKLWDAPVFNLAASNHYGSLALATGSDGLYELPIKSTNYEPVTKIIPNHLAENHCNSCGWSYQSIYGSSNTNSSFLASFEIESQKKSNESSNAQNNAQKGGRKFKEIIPSEQLFRTKGFSWGARDKIYQYHDGVIDVISYDPRHKKLFKDLGAITLSLSDGDVISANVAPFGTVIECDNSLVIALSNGEFMTVEGEPVRWRVFPRSTNFTNQLHIIYDDRIEILSFVHDYLVKQEDKLAGIKVDLR
jgi:hypothetical protein